MNVLSCKLLLHEKQTTQWRCLALGLIVLMLAPGCALVRRVQEPWQRSWNGFSQPAQQDSTPRLLAVNGYEPGKIPVIFIHGLMSDHSTWDEPISQLQQDHWIRSRYQFWTYHYPTGVSYLQSAAELREELRETLHTVDPNHHDPALNNMVLVGHSMGGLLAKLQVTSSGDQLWHTISDRPIEQVLATDTDRVTLARAVYFSPLPNIRRVVFMATPHAGSEWTERPIGRWGRSLIEFPSEAQENYQQWLTNNQGLLNDVSPHIPTSLDHMAPDSLVLQATTRLPIARGVKLHSIIGTGYWQPDWSVGDGIVSQASAHLPGVASELEVGASHSYVHKEPAAIEELRRILVEHASAE